MRPALLQSRSYTGHNLQDFKQDVTCPFTKQMLHRTQLTEFYTRCDLPFHKAEATQYTTYGTWHTMWPVLICSVHTNTRQCQDSKVSVFCDERAGLLSGTIGIVSLMRGHLSSNAAFRVQCSSSHKPCGPALPVWNHPVSEQFSMTILFMPCGWSLTRHFMVMVSNWVQHSFYLFLCFSSSVKTSLCF